MRGRWGLALTAAALAASGAAEDTGAAATAAARQVVPAAVHGTACELPRVDRARTPSIACMACHDGGSAPSVEFSMSTGGMSHPVTIDYEAAARRHPGSYTPSASLPPEVPLVDGRVECTTCHDGSRSTRKWVVDEARLCSACHRM
jgi:predicted CXXCH cytochrome family protein